MSEEAWGGPATLVSSTHKESLRQGQEQCQVVAAQRHRVLHMTVRLWAHARKPARLSLRTYWGPTSLTNRRLPTRST